MAEKKVGSDLRIHGRLNIEDNNNPGDIVFDVQGTSGQLFSITDSLVGDLFSVNDISGLPILTVNSDDLVTINGTTISDSFVKEGGLATEFLKADGSVDTNNYITLDAANTNYVNVGGDTMTGDLEIDDINSEIRAILGPNNLKFYRDGVSYISQESVSGWIRFISNGVPAIDLTGTSAKFYGDIIRDGGTSSQFLKADGSLDSNSYYHTGNFTPSNYVQISGDTMTGPLGIGTTPSVSDDTLLHLKGTGSGTGNQTRVLLENPNANGTAKYSVKNAAGDEIAMQVTGSAYAVPNFGAFVAYGLDLGFATDGNINKNGTHNIKFSPGGYDNFGIVMTPGLKMGIGVGSMNPTEQLEVDNNVLASSFRVRGGTASQFLKGDGSLDTNSYYHSGNFTPGNYVSKWETWNADLNISGDIVPTVNDMQNLGSPTKMWKDLYLGPGSLYVNGKKVIEDVSDTMNFTTDLDQNLVVKTSGIGNLQLHASGTGDVELTAPNGLIQLKGSVSFQAGKLIRTTDGTDLLFDDSIQFSAGTGISGDLSVTGDTTATSFIKSGGTASQFLKADGSVDTTTYVNVTSVTPTNPNPSKHEIADIEGVSIEETVTSLNTPTLTGNTLSIKLVNENNIEQIVTVDLSSLNQTSSGIANATYNASTNIITITEDDATEHTIDLSEFSNLMNTDAQGVTTLTQEGVVKLTTSKVGQSGLFADLLSKPTTISGYGITDNIAYTDVNNYFTTHQNITTTGWGGLTLQSSTTDGAVLRLLNTQRQFEVGSRNNSFDIRDITAGDVSRFTIDSTGKTIIGGAGQVSGGFIVDGVANFNGAYLNVGGGAGSSGTSIDNSGNIQTDGSFQLTGGTASQFLKADGSIDSNAYALDSHKYHRFNNGEYAYDDYNQNSYLRLFTENATYSQTRYQPVAAVEYHNGTSWISWAGENEIKKLLDGRQETSFNVPHDKRKFRFEVTRNSGWPTTALIMLQTSWSGISYTPTTVTIETWDGVAWNVKSTSTFGSGTSGGNYGIHLKADTSLHDGNTRTRVTIDITDWVDNGTYVNYPLRNFEIFSNYSGEPLEPWSWDYDKKVDFGGSIVLPENDELIFNGGAKQSIKGWSGRITMNFGGTEYARFTAGGLRIGTGADATEMLDVRGNALIGGDLYVNNTGGVGKLTVEGNAAAQLSLIETDRPQEWKHIISGSNYYIEPENTNHNLIIRNVANNDLFVFNTNTGSLTSNSFIKSGATSDDILLGDGSTTSLGTIQGDYVKKSGDTMSGNLKVPTLTIESATDQKLVLKVTDSTGGAGVSDGAWNYIGFVDAEGDRQGYFGINPGGDFVFNTEVAGARVEINSDLYSSTNIQAASFIRTGGTASQFLKADGSVDGTDYVDLSSDQSIYGLKEFQQYIQVGTSMGNPIIFMGSDTDNRRLYRQNNELKWMYDGTNDGTIYHTGNLQNLSDLNDDLVYDNYTSWNLKTNGIQRTQIYSSGNGSTNSLDIVAQNNIAVTYGAGGVVTLDGTHTHTEADITDLGDYLLRDGSLPMTGKLNIENIANNTEGFQLTNADGNPTIRFRNAGGPSRGEIYIDNNGSNRTKLTALGSSYFLDDVGIGTTTPTEKLQVAGTTRTDALGVGGSVQANFLLDVHGQSVTRGDVYVSDAIRKFGSSDFTITNTNSGFGTSLTIQEGLGLHLEAVTGNVSVDGLLHVDGIYSYENSIMRIPIPKGGSFNSNYTGATTPSSQGAIKIKLPVSANVNGLGFTVDLTSLAPNTKSTILIKGRWTGTGWDTPTSTIIGSIEDVDLAVRFGNEAGIPCVWIGETTTYMNHLKVQVRDVFVISSDNSWAEGWSVSQVTTFDTVQVTNTDNFPFGDFNKLKNTPSTLDGFGLTTEADNRYVNVTGDTMSGNLQIQQPNPEPLSISRNGFNVWSFRNTHGGLGIDNNSLIIKPRNIDGVASDFAIKTTVEDSGVPNLVVKANGNVGIGTATPEQKLHVAGRVLIDSVATGDAFTVEGGDGISKLRIDQNGDLNTLGHLNGSKIIVGHSYARIERNGYNMDLFANNTKQIDISSTATTFYNQLRVRNSDNTHHVVHAYSGDNQDGILKVNNGLNVGFMVRGTANSPVMGAYNNGSLNIAGFSTTQGGHDSPLATFYFGTRKLKLNGALEVDGTDGIKSTTNEHLRLFASGSGHYYFGNAGEGGNIYHYSAANDGNYASFSFSGSTYNIGTSGNAFSFSDNVIAPKLIKSGATSDDILLGDGTTTSLGTIQGDYVKKSGDTMSGNLYASTTDKLGGFTVLPGGYVESNPLNFRFDESQTAYIGDRGGVITFTGGSSPSEDNLKRLFTFTENYINLDTYKDVSNNVVIELTNISLSNSANTSWKPYAFFHSSGGVPTNIKIELKGGNDLWETAYDGPCSDLVTLDGFHILTQGVLKGAKWTFTGITNNSYLRMIGVIGKTVAPYQWNLLKSGGDLYGDLKIVRNSNTGSIPALVVGSGGNANMKARHVEGKAHDSDLDGTLHLNYYSGLLTSVGGDLDVNGASIFRGFTQIINPDLTSISDPKFSIGRFSGELLNFSTSDSSAKIEFANDSDYGTNFYFNIASTHPDLGYYYFEFNDVEIMSLREDGEMNLTGNITSNSFIKSGATSDDILLGDGSTTSLGTIQGDYVKKSGDTITGDLTFKTLGYGIKFTAVDDSLRSFILGDHDGPTDNDALVLGSRYGDTVIVKGDYVSGTHSKLLEFSSGLDARFYGKIIKDGGTASQFLKADGSVDSNSYSVTTHTHDFKSEYLQEPGTYHASNTDFNTLQGGFSGIVPTGSPNSPGTGSNGWWYVETQNQYGTSMDGDVIQTAYPFRTGNGDIHFRTTNADGAWNGWNKLHHTGNLQNLSDLNDDLVYDNYTSWNLKTNGVQRTQIYSSGSGSTNSLDIVAQNNIAVTYGAGGVVTLDGTHNHDTQYLKLTGGNVTGTIQADGLLLDIGEGLSFVGDENYFGTNADARIIRLIDVNSSNGFADGGLVIEGYTPSDGLSEELLVVRNNTFTWKGNDIYHSGNISGVNVGALTDDGTYIKTVGDGQRIDVISNVQDSLASNFQLFAPTGTNGNEEITFSFHHGGMIENLISASNNGFKFRKGNGDYQTIKSGNVDISVSNAGPSQSWRRTDSAMLWELTHAGDRWSLMSRDTSHHVVFGLDAASVDQGNKVGIGKAPVERLDVNGNTKSDAFIKSGATSDDILLGDGTTTSLNSIVDVTPSAPTTPTATIVGETIDVSFGQSATADVDNYVIFSSVDGGSYGLISVIPSEDFAPTMSVIDTTFTASGTIAYRIYAVKNGQYSTPATASATFTAPALEPSNVNAVNLNTVFYIQWDKPDSRFVSHYNVYKDADPVEGNLNRTNATLIYSGNNHNYMYQIADVESEEFHQFWVEIITK